jgi:gamma-glutamylputrescine oxidase
MTKAMDAQADHTPQSLPATWYEATAAERPRRPRLTFDLDADVCVIGGGLAGLTVAREVARRGWSVVVLEAARIAQAATGRSSGFVMPGYSEDIDTMIERIGLDHAKQLWALSQTGVDYVRKAIAEIGIKDAALGDGWLQASKTDNWRDLQNRAERLRWLGVGIEAWPAEQVRQVISTERYFGALHYPRALHIHPLNYAYGIAGAAEEAGARIFEDTPALELDPAGVRKRVQTPAARVRAAHVVLAANVQLGNLMPRLGATVMPLTTYVMVTQPIENLAAAIRYEGAVTDTRRLDNHYRVVDGNRLQLSGRMTAWPSNPQRFARALRGSIRRLFPQLGAIEPAHLWPGTFGRTLHHMPQIGEVHPGVWISSGLGAHGLNTSALAGNLIARGIVEGDQTWRLFAPYELVWAGGRVFRAAAKALYLGSRPLSGVREAWARRRERARRRRDLKAQKRRDLIAARTAPPPAPAAPAEPAAANPPKKPRTRAKGQPAKVLLDVPDLIEPTPRKRDEQKKP